MPTPGEHKTVQSRILQYAREIGWTYVPRGEAEKRRGFDPDALTPEDRARKATPYFGDRLHNTDLIVGRHDRHERGIVANDSAQSLDIDETGRVYGQDVDMKVMPAKVPHGLKDTFMLRRTRHHVITTP